MIQRIQTVYLLLAAALFGGQFAAPYFSVGDTATPGLPAEVTDGRLTLTDNIGMMGLTVLGLICAVAAVFLYKNRNLQGRIAGVTALVAVLLLGLAGFATYKIASQGVAGTYGPGLACPLLAAVVLWLAQRSINKDEQLVKSMDRLR